MTAYGECHKCGAWTGYDPYHGQPVPLTDRHVHPGDYRAHDKVWECYDCEWTPETARQRGDPGPRLPGESRQQWRKRMKGKA